MEECVDAIAKVTADPIKHRAAAYDVAREYLAPDRVLTPMIDAIFAKNREAALLPRGLNVSP
jgi:hypothetical protein